jgi:tetratricopeptide (TPR) repeat protein
MKIRFMARHLVPVLLIALVEHATPAFAESDPKTAARAHFERGVTAFNERRYADAAQEFDTAYRLSPAFVVLYNIGQVDAALGRSVEAVDAFDEYLKQGASAVPLKRRAEVQAEIEAEFEHIGAIVVHTTPEAAEIRLDGKLVGKTPLGHSIRATAGKHTVEAVLAAHATEVREIDLAGRAEIMVDFTLAENTVQVPAPAPPATALAPTPVAPNPVTVQIVEPSPAPARTATENPAAPASPAIERSAPINWLRIGGYVIAVGGLAVGTAGTIAALRGTSEANDAQARLSSAATPADYDAAYPSYDHGKRLSQAGWTVAGIGGAVLLGGLLVALAAPDRNLSALAIGPWVANRGGGGTFTSTW